MRVAVCQINSRDDRSANLSRARRLLERAADAGADLAVLPEYVDYLGPAAGEPEPEPVDGSFAEFFAEAARDLSMWVHAGSFHEVGPRGDPRGHNTSLVFDRSGRLAATYRKIHLYDVAIPERVTHRESALVAPGDGVATVDVEGVRLGLSICYDLRFPELYRALAAGHGASVLVVPAAFMMHTGRDHWELLLRARAVENQCYVLAAAQIGDHEPGRTCYGRSMVIDPWGTVIAQAADVEGVTLADLDPARLDRIRTELPSLANRRLTPGGEPLTPGTPGTPAAPGATAAPTAAAPGATAPAAPDGAAGGAADGARVGAAPDHAASNSHSRDSSSTR